MGFINAVAFDEPAFRAAAGTSFPAGFDFFWSTTFDLEGIPWELRFGDVGATERADAVPRDEADFGPDFAVTFPADFEAGLCLADLPAAVRTDFFGAALAGDFFTDGLEARFADAFTAFAAGVLGADFFAAAFFAAGFFTVAFFGAGFLAAIFFAGAAFFFGAGLAFGFAFAGERSFFTTFTSAFAFLIILAAVFLTDFTALAVAVFFAGFAAFLATLVVPPQNVDTTVAQPWVSRIVPNVG